MRKASDESKGKIPNDLQTIRRLVDQLIILLNRMVTLATLTRISTNVGLQDLENAYSGVLKLLENTNAVRLVDVAIKLDHAPGFPESEVADLHAHLSRNAFADSVLRDLVLFHIAKFDVSRSLRQRLAALFGLKANAPALMDPSRKR
jgi:hypothetical protein